MPEDVSVAELEKSDFSTREIFGRKPKPQSEEKKPEEFIPHPIEDEFTDSNAPYLKPLDRTIVKDSYRKISITLDEEFKYWSRTQSLEVGTARTKILEEITSKLTEGTDIKARVVIMNRGKEPRAWTTPDGTIFISQSLINQLSSLDEIAGVLAHEVGHLIFATSESRSEATNVLCEFGIGWAHEAASDLKAPDLLEKAGFRSTAFIDAIKIISGGERGTVHQSGLSRAAQNIMLHAGIDYTTSGIESQQIPPVLKTESVVPTNLEVFRECVAKGAYVYVERIGSLLHPKDFRNAEKIVVNQQSWEPEIKEKQVKILEGFHSLLRNRLIELGYTKDEIELFLLLHQESGNTKSFRLIGNPERLVELTEMLGKFGEQDKLKMMRSDLLLNLGDSDKLAAKLLNTLKFDSNDIEHPKGYGYHQYKIPVTRDIIIKVLSRISSLPDNFFSGEKGKSIAEFLATYVEFHFGEMWLEEGKYKKDVRNFLLKAKAVNLPLDFDGVDIPKYKKIFTEVFGITKESLDLFKEIDRFLEAYTSVQPAFQDTILKQFLGKFEAQIAHQKISDGKLLKLLEYFSQNLDSKKYAPEYSLSASLEAGKRRFEEPITAGADLDFEERLLKFNLKATVALSLFKKDNRYFYSFIEQSMRKSGIDPKSLSKNQLVNLCINLLNISRETFPRVKGGMVFDFAYYVDNKVSYPTDINNYARFLKLPFIAEILNKPDEALSAGTLKDLNEAFDKVRFLEFSVFEDGAESVLFGKEFRRVFVDILQRGIKEEEELTDLYTVVSRIYPQSPQKDEILRGINRKFLLSPRIGIREKIDHFYRNADQLGPEGAIMVADQITTLPDYLYLRERLQGRLEGYLKGDSEKPTQMAIADNVTAELVKDFRKLLDTSKDDLNSKRVNMGRLAKIWKDAIEAAEIKYDERSDKLALDSQNRSRFLTLSDVIKYLKNLTPIQRFGISQKALLDRDGALTNDVNRKYLAKSLVDSLGLSSGFVAKALSLATTDAPADFISIPASQMLSNLLFRGLDINFLLDPGKFRIKGIPTLVVPRLMRQDTRSATLFGPRYTRNPGSLIAKLAVESDQQYQVVTDKLREFISEEKPEQKKKSEVSPSTEAIIKGVEMTGALGVRSLQLARQLHRFPEDVDRRLSQAFDARPGLSKLLFWENLVKTSQNGNGIKDLSDRLITLDEYLGGGSLYTTFAGVIRNPDGTTSQVAIKLLNPNPEFFIEQPYKIVGDILRKIGNEGKPEEKQYAKMAQVFLDLSNRWCLNDINDPTFEKDDDAFRQTIGRYNQTQGQEVFYAPRRIYNSKKVKSEEKAPGRTLNQVLNDPAVSASQKSALVQAVNQFFAFQTKTPFKDTQGKEYFLVHSDPHIGNFMIDLRGEQPRIGIIDRNMYLKLEREDVELFQPLIEGKSYGSMLEPMIERLLDKNKIVSEKDRKSIKGKILFGVRGEFIVQTWESLKRLRFKPDNFAILRRFMGEAANAGLDIPLEYQLMIRNVEAFRELSRRYGASAS